MIKTLQVIFASMFLFGVFGILGGLIYMSWKTHPLMGIIVACFFIGAFWIDLIEFESSKCDKGEKDGS